jgi:hypothetical protein
MQSSDSSFDSIVHSNAQRVDDTCLLMQLFSDWDNLTSSLLPVTYQCLMLSEYRVTETIDSFM